MYIALIIIMIWTILGSVFYDLSIYEKNEWNRSLNYCSGFSNNYYYGFSDNYYYDFSDLEYPGREKTIFGRILYMIFGPFAAVDYIIEFCVNTSFECYRVYKRNKRKTNG